MNSSFDVAVVGPTDLLQLTAYLDVSTVKAMPSGLGGTPTVHLVRGLVDRGYRVLLVTLDKSVLEPLVLRGDSLEVRVGMYRPRKRARDLFAAERAFISHELSRAAAPVAHAHWTYEFAWGALSSGVPTVVSAHDAPLRILRFDRSPYRLARTLMAQYVCHQSTHMTAVSRHVATHLRRWFGAPERIRVVPNGIEVPATTKKLPGDSGRSLAAPKFGAVANGWSTLKNVSTLLRAFQSLRHSLPESELHLYGGGYGSGEVAFRWANSRDLASGVVFHGAIGNEDLLCELQGLDVFVHPSLEEAHPMAVVEAMACGLPVIGGVASGGVPELLENGAGILVDVRRPSEVVKAMYESAVEGALRLAVAQRGAEVARSSYSVEVMLDGYERSYADALGVG